MAADPRTQAVAGVLDTYFQGINSHNPGSALSVFDPAGSNNPNDPDLQARFSKNTSTSFDDEVAITEIRDDTDNPGGFLVHVLFRSQQQAQFGPDNETCTHWDLSYKFTSAYKILKSQGALHSAC